MIIVIDPGHKRSHVESNTRPSLGWEKSCQIIFLKAIFNSFLLVTVGLPIFLSLSVKKARGLKIKGKDGTNDAFVTIALAKEKYQTSVKEKATETVEWWVICYGIPSFCSTFSPLNWFRTHRNSCLLLLSSFWCLFAQSDRKMQAKDYRLRCFSQVRTMRAVNPCPR